MERQQRTKKPPQLPDVGAGDYLVQAFFDIGMAGDDAVSWAEIEAFARMTGDISRPWEARIIRQMSSEYLSGRGLGRDPLAIEPWRPHG